MINKRKLGYRLSSLVHSTGRKQWEVAHDLGVQDSSLSQWVTGRWVPNLESMYKIAKYFGTTVDALLDGCVE